MEFENLQIEVPTADDDTEALKSTLNPAWEKKYYNSSKGFVVGLDLSSKEAVKRKESRAKRFGVKIEGATESGGHDPFLEMDLKDMEFPPVTDAAVADKRPDTLHLHGVSNMSTKEVFEYFKGHGPDTMEWVDDHSCNVIWEVKKMAKTAMAAMSRTLDELKEIGNVTIPTDCFDETGKSIWRIAKPYKRARYLFLRQATIADRKLPGAAKRSLYYLIHGRGIGGKGGIVSSSRKRRMEQANNFLREKLKSKNPEVQFLSVNDRKPQNEVDNIMDMDIDDSPVPKKRQKGFSGKGKMYSDESTFSGISKEENLRIEVSNTSTKWTSNKKNQHKRGGSDSNNDSDGSEDKFDYDSCCDEKISHDSVGEKLPVISDSKGVQDNEKCDGEDLRDQIKTTDLRGKIRSRSSQKNKQDLRTRLQQKKKHIGLSKEQLNLCIEVTEVSDED